MTYTEIKKRNEKTYFYRALSVRKRDKVTKKRKYLGADISQEELLIKEAQADKELLSEKINKNIEKIKSSIIPILKKNKIKKAGIFGSYARGEQRKKSDVDILVEPAKNMGFAFVGLQFELEKKLKKRVDLVSYNGLNKYMKDNILKQEVRIIG